MSIIPNSGVYIAPPGATATSAQGTQSGSMTTTTAYTYKLTFVTGYGETEASSTFGSITPSIGSAVLSAIPTSSDANVIARKLYRNTTSGLTTWGLLATIPDKDITTSYTDSAADAAVSGVSLAPDTNTSYSIQTIKGSMQESMPKLLSWTTVAATGTNAGTASLLKLYPRQYLTASTTGQGTKLPAARTLTLGFYLELVNESNQAILIYPYEGSSTIVAAGVSAASYSLSSYAKGTFHLVSFSSGVSQWKCY